MSTRIIHKKNDTAGVVPVVSGDATNELELGEIAINTHDGKMFIRQDADGTISLKEIGKADEVQNVLYVSKSGADTNNGKTLGDAFLTIKAALDSLDALEQANPGSTAGTTIFVKSGEYVENNDTPSDPAEAANNPMGGMVVPKNVSIVGDNLRTTKVSGTTPGNDLFYVQNASYITNLTFGFSGGFLHADPSKPRPPACVSFPPIALQQGGVPNAISTSPYVENCTSFNRNATGMLIDGSLTTGLRSMVSDSFTQINAGGTGVHLLNRGYAQLVSIFTVSCEHAVLCESGGQCSLTNSNASFGTFGLKATGASETLYAGALTSQSVAFDRDFEISTTKPPKYGDAFLVNDKDNQLIAKCGRDVKLILDAIGQDTILQTNFNSIYAGISYKRANALPADQVTPTSDALFETKRLVGLLDDIAANSTLKATVDGKFDVVTGIINNQAVPGDYTEPGSSHSAYTTPNLHLPNTLSRHNAYFFAASNMGGPGAPGPTSGALLSNRQFIQEEINAFVLANNPPAGYDQDKCKRDVGYIVDAVCYDLMYGGNSATLNAARSYFVGAVSELPSSQVASTVAAYARLADVVDSVIQMQSVTTSGSLSVTQLTNGNTSNSGTLSSTVGDEAHDLVEIIKDMIEDGDLEALPSLLLPTFPTIGDGATAKAAIDENKRELRQATTDWVIINTGIDDNFYYSVEGVEASVDFVGTDYKGLAPVNIPSPTYIQGGATNYIIMDRVDADGNPAGPEAAGLGHGFVQGQPLKYSCTGTPIQGLENGRVYFAHPVPGLNLERACRLQSVQRNFWEYNGGTEQNIVDFENTGFNAADNHTFTPGFYYNKNKCHRDVGLIIDAVRDDMLLGTNFNSVYTGISYQRASAYTTVTNTDQKAPTLAAMIDVKNTLSQLPTVNASDTAYHRVRAAVDEIIHIFEDGTESVSAPGDGVADKLFLPNTLNKPASIVQAKDDLLANKLAIQDAVITHVNNNFTGLGAFEPKCRRDVGYIVDGLAYDLLYDTNTASIRAAQSYFITSFDVDGTASSVSQLAAGQSAATISAYTEMKSDNGNGILESQLTETDSVTKQAIVADLDTLMDIIIDHITNGTPVPAVDALDTTNIATNLVTASTQINSQKSTIQSNVGNNVDIYRVLPLEDIRDDFVPDGNGDLRFTVDFRKRSLIAASSMTFEYVGTGTEIQGVTDGGANTDDLYNRPRTDDFPKTENEVIQDSTTNLGAVYFTSTDHKGDFRIGSEMRINRTDGRIEGDTFNRSLFSVMTPYILAIEGN